METSKPMSDGGKGSVRRNEDSDAYRSNYDAIFGRKKEQQTMNTHDEDDYIEEEDIEDEEHEWSCDYCGGPMHRTENGQYGQCGDCGRYCDLESDY